MRNIKTDKIIKELIKCGINKFQIIASIYQGKIPILLVNYEQYSKISKNKDKKKK